MAQSQSPRQNGHPKFNPQTDIPNLSGKVCLVTGGNSGLGEASLKAMAQHNPSKLYLGARSKSKALGAIERIRSSSASAQSVDIEFLELDLASLESVKTAAARVNKEAQRLDILMLNGGIAMVPAGVTKDGYEVHFGVNYLSHALLTQLLMPKLLETTKMPGADVRVVSMASVSHKVFPMTDGILFDGLRSTMAPKLGPELYGQAMLAKILFALEGAKRYPSITFSSLHPGTVKTDAWEGEKSGSWFLRNLFLKPLVIFTGVTADEGAKTQLWCSFSKDVVSGTYYEPIGKYGEEGPSARDEKLASRLWEWTDKQLNCYGSQGWQ
jgi:NAD(P)-dependent dehydrogenase (short-subunit alcohol dehydrogenase family)